MLYVSVLTDAAVDLLFALLGGSIVGILFALAGTVKSGVGAGLMIFMVSIIAAGLLWLVGLITLLKLHLYIIGNAAMIFDLILGMLGALIMAASYLDHVLKAKIK